jgi:ABC-2 type transport system permease protein
MMFLWQLSGSLLSGLHWLLDFSPFQHVGLVPTEAFHASAVVMLAVAAIAAMTLFERRDLVRS